MPSSKAPGPTEVVALCEVDPEFAQHVQGVLILYAFRDRLLAEALRDGDDRLDESLVCLVVEHLAHELDVDFEVGDGKLAEVGE